MIEIKLVLIYGFWIIVIIGLLCSDEGRKYLGLGITLFVIGCVAAFALRAPRPAAVTTRIDDAKAAYETYKMRRDLRKIADEITDTTSN